MVVPPHAPKRWLAVEVGPPLDTPVESPVGRACLRSSQLSKNHVRAFYDSHSGSVITGGAQGGLHIVSVHG